MRLKLISCDVFSRALAVAVARSANRVELEFLPFIPNSCPAKADQFQAALERVPPGQYQAVLLGGGPCLHGWTGLQARDIPLVIPRRLDCGALRTAGHCPGSAWSDAAQDVNFETADQLEWQACREAGWFGWDFEKAPSELALLQRFVDGYWSHHEFLAVPAGGCVVACGAEGLVEAEVERV